MAITAKYQRLREDHFNDALGVRLKADTRVWVVMMLASGVCRCRDSDNERYWVHEDRLRPETSQEVLEALLEGEW